MIVDRKMLLSQLRLVKPSRKQSISILGCVRLHVDGPDCVIEATDLERAYVLPIEGVTESPSRFDTLVNLTELIDVLTAISHDAVWLDQTAAPDPLLMVARAGGQRTEAFLSEGAPLEDWPVLPTLEPGAAIASVSLTRTELADAVALVYPAASRDETRPTLTCIGFDLEAGEGGQPVLATTDSYRLHVARPCGLITQLDTSRIEARYSQVLPVSARWVKQVSEWAKKHDRQVASFTFTERTVFARFDQSDMVTSCRLVDGAFPRWRQLLDNDWQHRVTVAPGSLVEAAKMARAKLGTRSTSPMLVELNDGQWLGRSTPGDAGTPLATEPGGAWPEPGFRIGFNPDFLAEAARCIGAVAKPGQMAELQLLSPVRPALLSAEGWRCLVMPVRVEQPTTPTPPPVEPRPEPEAAEPEAEPEPEPTPHNQARQERAKDNPRNLFLAKATALCQEYPKAKRTFYLQSAGWMMAERKSEPKPPAEMSRGMVVACHSRLRREATAVGYTLFTK